MFRVYASNKFLHVNTVALFYFSLIYRVQKYAHICSHLPKINVEDDKFLS
jgi:hypothetical protein